MIRIYYKEKMELNLGTSEFKKEYILVVTANLTQYLFSMIQDHNWENYCFHTKENCLKAIDSYKSTFKNIKIINDPRFKKGDKDE